MPDTQFAELPQAEDAFHREDVPLACLEGIVVGLRDLQVQLPWVAINAKQNDVDTGICSCSSYIWGLHTDLVLCLCNSGNGDESSNSGKG